MLVKAIEMPLQVQVRVCVGQVSLVVLWLEIHLLCRGLRVDLRWGRIPHGTEQLGPCATLL